MTEELIGGYTVALCGVPEKEQDYMQRCVAYGLETLKGDEHDLQAADTLKKSLGKMLRRYAIDIDVLDQANKTVSITFIKVEQHDLQEVESPKLREHQRG